MYRTRSRIWGALLTLMIAISCSAPSEDGRTVNDIAILNADAPLRVDFNELVDSVSYIALDTRQCLVGDIDIVKRDGDMLFVKDNKGLYAFNSSGMFVSKIGTKGNGAHEYMYIQAFYLDKKSKHVCIVSHPDNKLLEYSYSGKFISVASLSENTLCMDNIICRTSDSLVVYNALSNDVKERPAEYTLLTNASGQWQEEPLLGGIRFKSQNVRYPFLYNSMTLLHGNVYAVSGLSDIVYKHSGKGMLPAFRVSLPKLCPPGSVLQEYEDMDFFSLRDALCEKGYGLGLAAITSIGNDLVLSLPEFKAVVTDGCEGIVIDSKVYNKDTDIHSLSFFTSGISEDNLGYIEASSLLKKREHIMQGDNRQLKTLLETLSTDDNPIVYQYHFKKGLMETLKYKLAQQT